MPRYVRHIGPREERALCGVRSPHLVDPITLEAVPECRRCVGSLRKIRRGTPKPKRWRRFQAATVPGAVLLLSDRHHAGSCPDRIGRCGCGFGSEILNVERDAAILERIRIITALEPAIGALDAVDQSSILRAVRDLP